MRWAAGAAVGGLALGLVGCGDDDFGNEPRAPAEITISASVTPREVTVSPARVRAGTVELIASNLTPTSQRVTLRSATRADNGSRVEQRTGPINPGDTASLKADLVQGTYEVTAMSESIDAATITVGPQHMVGEDGLLQP